MDCEALPVSRIEKFKFIFIKAFISFSIINNNNQIPIIDNCRQVMKAGGLQSMGCNYSPCVCNQTQLSD